ncbi:MAG: hypothetical protein WCD89_15100 [Anaerocolumna sp.]
MNRKISIKVNIIGFITIDLLNGITKASCLYYNENKPFHNFLHKWIESRGHDLRIMFYVTNWYKDLVPR